MNIDFTTDRYVCGEFGEHNAESLVVSIPQDMQNAGSAYRLAFLGVASLSPVRTHPLTPENNKVTYSLPQSVTSMREADMTLEEYNGDDLLRKSTMVRLVFNCAVPDGDESIDESPALVEEITANTAARHTHANKTVLDKFGESEGAPTYDGAAIGGTALVEILQQGSYARYTATELIALYVEGKIFTYGGNIVTNIRTASNLFTFSVLEYEVYNSVKTPVLRSYSVNSSKQITQETDAKSQLYLPYSVNGKTFANANAVTLKAADITASAGWSPSDDKDLATKKYVDDNAGGTPDWSDIQNKPASYPPSAHTHQYSDITDPPTIPTAGTITSGSTGYATGGDVYTALQGASGWVAQTTAPLDTSLLWIDTDDNTVEQLVDADSNNY